MSFEKLEEYDDEFIVKLLYCLITDKDYLYLMYDSIDVKYFDESAQQWIVNEVLKYYKTYNSNPSSDYFSTEVKKFKNLDEKNKPIVREINEILKRVFEEEFEEVDYVKEEFKNFIREKAVINSILESVDLAKAGMFDELLIKIESASRIGEKNEIDFNYKGDLESRYSEADKKILPFPFEEWNEITNGGMRVGDLILFFAPQGIGKSWLSVICADYLLKNGYNVVYFTLELDSEYVARRFDATASGIALNKLSQNLNKVEEAIEDYTGELTIKRLKGKSRRWSVVKKILNRYKKEGKKIDLLIIDYIDLLKYDEGGNKDVDSSEELFNEVRDFGSESGYPIISPAQINRAGSKDRVIENDKMSGSFKKGMIADISISLSRTNEDKLDNLGVTHWQKNRYGYDGMSQQIYLDTSCGKMEILGDFVEKKSDNSSLKQKLKNNYNS